MIHASELHPTFELMFTLLQGALSSFLPMDIFLPNGYLASPRTISSPRILHVGPKDNFSSNNPSCWCAQEVYLLEDTISSQGTMSSLKLIPLVISPSQGTSYFPTLKTTSFVGLVMSRTYNFPCMICHSRWVFQVNFFTHNMIIATPQVFS